ncbi:MAG: hypothetical protein EZS28_041092, partial [Streblomastix strix]
MLSEGEAEALCVALERMNLVDGIVSEDSDCFAFGAKLVIRGMLQQKSDIYAYSSNDIESYLGLTNKDIISLAQMLGCDYSEPVKGIGLMRALQLILSLHQYKQAIIQSGGDEDEFPDDQLLLIKEWIDMHQKNDEDENKDNIDQEKDNDDINLIDKDDNMEENTNEEEDDKDYDNINQIIGKNKNQKSKQNKMQKKINSLKQHPLDKFLHKQLLQLAKHNKIKISKLFPDSEVNDAFIAPKAIPYDFNIQQIIDIEKPFSNGEEDCK